MSTKSETGVIISTGVGAVELEVRSGGGDRVWMPQIHSLESTSGKIQGL